MENLTILEKEALEMLKQLERCCEVSESDPDRVKKEKCVYVMYTDLKLAGLDSPERTQEVVSYLQRNGVNFEITFDSINDIPEMYIDDEHPSYAYIEFGRIEGENLGEITLTIKKLIQKLTQNEMKRMIIIKYKINLGQLSLNEDTIEFEGIQKDILDILIKTGKEVKVSWDKINEEIEKIEIEILDKQQRAEAKKKINGAVSQINKKIVRYFGKDQNLIEFKDNEYWLYCDVEIDG